MKVNMILVAEWLTWDQALFSFRFEKYITENVWEPLKLGLISGYRMTNP